MKTFNAITASLFIFSQAVYAERIVMQNTAVIGNQELPKILYIVPWKKSELPNLSEPPLETLIDEALKPLDRNVFRRQVEYYQALKTPLVSQNENQQANK